MKGEFERVMFYLNMDRKRVQHVDQWRFSQNAPRPRFEGAGRIPSERIRHRRTNVLSEPDLNVPGHRFNAWQICKISKDS
jgi:hypothetical protein